MKWLAHRERQNGKAREIDFDSRAAEMQRWKYNWYFDCRIVFGST
jgi:hypothetical protein